MIYPAFVSLVPQKNVEPTQSDTDAELRRESGGMVFRNREVWFRSTGNADIYLGGMCNAFQYTMAKHIRAGREIGPLMVSGIE